MSLAKKMKAHDDLPLSNTTYNDINEGDFWLVNYPTEELEDKDDNNDSMHGSERPVLVIIKNAKISNRQICVIKGTTSSKARYNDPAYIVNINGFRLNCASISNLNPHHFLKKLGHISTSDPKFMKAVSTALRAEGLFDSKYPTYESAILESMSKSDREDIKQIVATFDKQELKLYGESSDEISKKEDKATVWCKVLYDGKIPMAYASCTDSGKLGLTKGDVNLAFGVNKNYRGKGLAKKLIKEAVHWFKRTDYDTLTYIYREGNKASESLAKKSGFIYMKKINGNEEWWMITNPSKLKTIGESAKSGKFKDMMVIYDSLSKEEKSYLGNKFVDSPATVFRKIAYSNDTNMPMGFVELYDVEKLHGNKDEVIIECAVHKNCRGKGIAKALCNVALQWFMDNDKYQKCVYLIKKGNRASKALCDALAFQYIYTEGDHDVYFFVKNDTPLTEEFIFGPQEEESNDVYTEEYEEPENPEDIARDIQSFVENAKIKLKSIDEMAGGGGPMIGMEINDQSVQYSTPGMYLISYGQKKISGTLDDEDNTSGYAIANDFYIKHIFVKKGKKAVKESYDKFLQDREFRIYEFIGEQGKWLDLLRSISEGTCEGDFYTDLTGRRLITHDQVQFDENFKYLNLWKVKLENSIIHPVRDVVLQGLSEDVMLLPVMSEEDMKLAEDFRKLNENWLLKEGVDGYYIVDEKSGFRSSAYDKEYLYKVLDK